jgi:hypothetical protein
MWKVLCDIVYHTWPLYDFLDVLLTIYSELHMYRGHQKTATGHIMVCLTGEKLERELTCISHY